MHACGAVRAACRDGLVRGTKGDSTAHARQDSRGRVRAAANPWTDTSAGEAVSNDARVAGSPRLKVGHLGRGRIGPHVRASAKPSERKRADRQPIALPEARAGIARLRGNAPP